MNIICYSKQTQLEYLQASGEWKNYLNRADPDTIGQIERDHANHKDFTNKLEMALERLGFNAQFFSYDQIREPMDHAQIVLTNGGDGTFLHAAHFFGNKKILVGANSNHYDNPRQGSIGGLTQITRSNLESALEKIRNEQYTIATWQRLFAKVNSEIVDTFAVNDIHIRNEDSDKTVDFDIAYSSRHDSFYGTSGLLAYSGMGSTAWAKNAGGAYIRNSYNMFGLVLREPNQDRIPFYTNAVIDGDETVSIVPSEPVQIRFDSRHVAIDVNRFDKIEVGLAKKNYLRVIEV